jgi:hypothetical protein
VFLSSSVLASDLLPFLCGGEGRGGYWVIQNVSRETSIQTDLRLFRQDIFLNSKIGLVDHSIILYIPERHGFITEANVFAEFAFAIKKVPKGS